MSNLHDDGVEKAIIGTALLNADLVPSIVDLSEKDFFFNTNKKVFRQIKDYYDQGNPIDATTIENGIDYLSHFTSDLLGYKKILKDKRQLRDVVATCQTTIQQANSGTPIDQLFTNFNKLSEDKAEESGITDMTGALMDVVKKIDEVRTGTSKLGLSTGLDFDKSLGGFEEGNFYVIAARPAMGKSAFALEVGKRIAETGIVVGVMSLEMSAQSLAMRLLTSEVGIDATELRKGKITEDQMADVVKKAEELSKIPIVFDDNSFVTPQSLRAKAHVFAKRHGVGMLIIDYLQLLSGTNESRERDIAEASRMCKVIAKELNIPVIALAQLNRGVEQRIDKRPMLSDLRESGAIEQDADAVLMLYRPEYYDQNVYGDRDPDEYRGQSTQDICEVLIVKNRNGDVGGIRQVFRKNLMKFENRSSLW